jgi:hypothetical protein
MTPYRPDPILCLAAVSALLAVVLGLWWYGETLWAWVRR